MKLIQKYQNPSGPLSWEQQYINITPPVKYNPVEANRPGFPKTQQFKTSRLSNFKNIFNKNVKNIFRGLTSFNAAPYAMFGVMTTPDTLPNDYHIEFIDGKPTAVEHNLGTIGVKDNIKNLSNKFQWNNKYWAKIGNKYKGLGYNEYMQEFNKWFDQQNFNSLEKDNRNYIAKQNWNKYVKLGYNKPVNVINDAIVTSNKYSEDSEDDYLNNNNIPPVAPPVQSSQQGFTPEQFFDTLFGNQEYARKFKQFLGIPDTSTESETTVKQPETPTYESLVKVNTASMNDNINSGNFRRQYRKAFNEALLNGTIYGANNPNGTLVFDSNAVMGYDEESGNPIYATAANIMQKYGLDGKISRRDMRMLRKDIIKNQNQVRMNNISNFLGIISPAVASPAVDSIISSGQPITPSINGQVTTGINDYGIDKANGYPNITNSFNGTSDIDPNAVYRAQQELENQKRLNG